MTHQQKIYGLALAVLLQLAIVIGLFVRAWYPLWIGEEVRVKTVPIDPRSLFRGNYAQLNYDFARVSASAFSNGITPERGETIYTVLRQTPDGLFELERASSVQPDDGIFLRGVVTGGYDPVHVDYGIDAFFAPKKKALKLESDLRNGGVAILKVGPNGRAAIEDVVANPRRDSSPR